MFRLAELFVEIGAKISSGLPGALASVHGRLLSMGAFGTKLSGVLHGVTMGFMGLQAAIGPVGMALGAAAIGAAVIGLGQAAFAAAHLEEAVAKVEQAFGSATPKIVAMADDLQHRFGALKTEILDVAASFGLMLQGAGIGRELSASMSVELSRIAVDAASYFDVAMSEAIMRIQSGLSGEMEAVRRWGINLTETNVKRKALAMGMKPGKGGEFDQSDKTVVREKLIMEGLKAAAGDAERSQYRLIGQSKILWGQLTELAITVGTVVVPVFTGLLWILNGLLRTVNFVAGGFLSLGKSLAQWVAGLFGYTDIFDEQGAAARQAAIDARIEQTARDQAADKAAAAAATAPKQKQGFQGGLEEYAKKIQEGAWQDPKTKLQQQQVAVAKQQLTVMQRLEQLIERQTAAGILPLVT